MKQQIKPYYVTEKICDTNVGIFKQEKYYKFNNKKFRIKFEHSNGYPLGFNYKKCLSIFDEHNNKWNNVHDINEINMKVKSYFSAECEISMAQFFLKMEQLMLSIY